MIGFLSGQVIHREDTSLTLLVSGVGYEVICTLNALGLTNQTKDSVSIWTHLIVREDVQQLFGFADQKERFLFRELIRVSGIGPKVALAILSGMDVSGLVNAIRNEDSVQLTKIPGIGKKTAERLVIEMKDRVSNWPLGEDSVATVTGTPDNTLPDVKVEIESALIALGYKPAESSRMVESLDIQPDETVETLIRRALRNKLG